MLLSVPATAATAAPTKADHSAEVARLARALVGPVSAVRGLRPKRKIATGVYDPAELLRFVTRAIDRDLGRGTLDLRSRALRVFGMLPTDYGLRDGLLAMLQEQVAGLYDPKTRELHLVRRSTAKTRAPLLRILDKLNPLHVDLAAQTRMVIAHELVHALQDQHFHLARMMRDLPGETDLNTALQALVEGDATIAMLAHAMQERGQWEPQGFFAMGEVFGEMMDFVLGFARMGLLPDSAELARAPRWLQESLIFPYIAGATFCLAAGERTGSFAGVDAVFADPPLSTEQILHPQKRLGAAPDFPVHLTLPALRRVLGKGWRSRFNDNLGELYVRVLLHDRLGAEAAARAAGGWGGDRYALYSAAGMPDVIVWLTTWDSDQDAGEFAAAGAIWLAARGSVADAGRQTAGVWQVDHADGTVDRMIHRGRDVALGLQLPASKAVAVVERLVSKTRRKLRRKLP